MTSNEPSFVESHPRITKENLYMILALLMEDMGEEDEESQVQKAGAVLVLPNEIICAADFSRDGVHAVARLLMKHPDKAKGSKIFVSRKPCPFCAKLLVQSKVERVLYLPLMPEYYRSPETTDSDTNKCIATSNLEQMTQVDNMLTTSVIGQTRFVLQVDKAVLKLEKKKKVNEDEVKNLKMEYMKKYMSYKWTKLIKESLPWPIFNGKIKAQIQKCFKDAMDWIASVQVTTGIGLNYEFKLVSDERGSFNPVDNRIHEKQARHFMTMARFLTKRTDDPRKGVGAVIVNKEMEIVAIGWNGFPLKAHYGDFSRASKHNVADDESGKKKEETKYPYVLHAEQNAILMRNTLNIEGSILFVTKSPCNECAPLIAMQGVTTVVVDDDVHGKAQRKQKPKIGLDYDIFPRMVKKGKFVCYQTSEKTTAKKRQRKDDGEKAMAKRRRRIDDGEKTTAKKRSGTQPATAKC